MVNLRNMGILGKPAPTNSQTKKGLFNQGDLNVNKFNTSGGLGFAYAQSYVASTGGTLTTYSGGADISAALSNYYNSQLGNALFLPPGSYTIDSGFNANFTHTYSSSVFPSGYYGVFGDDPQTTIITAIEDAGVSFSDNAVLSWDDTGNIQFDGGYFTLRFESAAGASSQSYRFAMFTGTDNNGDLTYGQFKNCAFNRNGGKISMLYDNGNDTGYIWLKNCSIGNVTTFYSNYSGSKTNKDAFNCLFEPAITTTQWGTLTDCVTNGSYLQVADDHTMTYNTLTYPTAGHLYDLATTSYSVPS